MDIEYFFPTLTDSVRLSGVELYKTLSDLGIELTLCHGRLEIVAIHNIDEKKLSSVQKAISFKLLHEKTDDLKEEYIRQNPHLKGVKYPSAYLKDNRELIIPSDCHGKYRYWLQNPDSSWKYLEKSQSIYETLLELNAPKHVMRRYLGEDFK